MAKVSFKAKGKPVSFTAREGQRGKGVRRRGKTSAWTRCVKANVGKYLRKGLTPQQAMKALAKDWRAGRC